MAYQHESTSAKRVRRVLTASGHSMGKLGGHLRAQHHGKVGDKEQDAEMIRSALRQHENAEHGGKHERIKLADGGTADGPMGMDRADKAPRGKAGGKGKDGKNHINIMIAPRGPSQPVPIPVGGPGGPGGPGAAQPHPMPPPPPPPMAGPPGGGMPPGMPPGAPPPRPLPPPSPGPMPGGMPMMRKRGGRARHDNDETDTNGAAEDGMFEANYHRRQNAESEKAKRGGGVGRGRADMSAGAGSGEGRLEKAEQLCGGGRS